MTLPPPKPTAQFTVMPATGLELPSVTVTESGLARARPATPTWLSPLVAAVLAITLAAVALNVTGAPVKLGAVAV